MDEEDLLDELLSKLRRRRRQAAGEEEIGFIEDERLQVRARLAALRSVKLAELKGGREVVSGEVCLQPRETHHFE